jgi:hypothetical protein
LLEAKLIHGPAQHAHVLLAIDTIQSSHRLVLEQRLVTNTLAVPHAVDSDA